MGIRTGQQYLNGLQDGRQVWLAGERVADVTKHPVLAAQAASVASLYDLQHDPSVTDQVTDLDPDSGERTAVAFRPPKTQQELRRRGAACKVMADRTFGMIGRSPDFLNIGVTAFASAADFFGCHNAMFADNMRHYWQMCRERDLFLAHATINPQTDRSRASAEQDDVTAHLRIVDENDQGIVMRGAKMIGTLVPIADELVVFPLPGYRPGDEAYTTAFAIPVATPGLQVVCREPFGGTTGRDLFDHPLARYDEMDATCVFDDVLVPWNRVFFRGDVDAANRLYDATTARHHTGHQAVIRGVAKAELLVGIAISLAEETGTRTFLHVQEMLGEVIGWLELTAGAVLRAEERATMSRWGTLTPDITAIQALRYHFPRAYARMVEVVQILGGGSLLSTPTHADLIAHDGPGVARYFAGRGPESGVERVRLLKLAWDATGDAFGQRQLQYERYHSGDPVRLAAQQYLAYDATPLRATVARVLGTGVRL